jgi:thiamine biosynthesis lipoprotein
MTLVKHGDVSIDLSAIAKGHAVDEVAGLLLSAGIDNYLVEIGGELASRGLKDTGEPWKVGIEIPVPGEAILFQSLKTGIKPLAIAASGNYRNVFHAKGRAYSHLIDPVSGAPITHDLAAVTVISESAMHADAWATALNIMGVDKGMELANQLQLAAYFIVADDGSFRSVHSDAFRPYLNQAQ